MRSEASALAGVSGTPNRNRGASPLPPRCTGAMLRRRRARISRMPATRHRRLPWSTWSAERLMQLRLRDLGVTIEGTWLQDCVSELYSELDAREIRLHPHVWLSDEWFSPGNVPGFAIPFYLAHPRLMKLE